METPICLICASPLPWDVTPAPPHFGGSARGLPDLPVTRRDALERPSPRPALGPPPAAPDGQRHTGHCEQREPGDPLAVRAGLGCLAGAGLPRNGIPYPRPNSNMSNPPVSPHTPQPSPPG